MEPVRVVRGRLQQTLHHQLKEEVENLQQNTLQVSQRYREIAPSLNVANKSLRFYHQGWCKG